MRRHRTTARGILLSLLLAGLAAAALASPSASGGERAVPKLVFPLVAKTLWWDNFGDPRPNGRHDGIDVEAHWRAPVVAVEAGKVEYADSSLGGCMLYLYGRSGTTYLYIHLNNDLTARNDNKGRCVSGVAFAVPNGERVAAGQQIAWNGDSGDADGNPHLHFEVHPSGGAAVNPFPHLTRAGRPLFAAKPGSPFSLGLRGKLISAGAGSVTLAVERVRHYPGGRWLEIDARTVELTVAAEASIPAELMGDVANAARRTIRTPVPVAVFTVKARATAEAIVGAASALRAGRVSPLR